jgi:hypothetical protein
MAAELKAFFDEAVRPHTEARRPLRTLTAMLASIEVGGRCGTIRHEVTEETSEAQEAGGVGKAPRAEETRQVVAEYIDDQRKILQKLRRRHYN